MEAEDAADYLDLLLLDRVGLVLNLDVCLQGLRYNLLMLSVEDPNYHLEGKLLERRDLVSEIARVFEDRDPDAHGVRLYQAVELVDVQTLVDVSFEFFHVIDAASLIPVVNLVVNPSCILQDLESFLASQELADECVEVVALEQRAGHFSFGNQLGFVSVVLGGEEALSLDPFGLTLYEVLNMLCLEKKVD